MITKDTITRLNLTLAEGEAIAYHWPELTNEDRKAYLVVDNNTHFRVYLKSKTHWFHSIFPYEVLANDDGIEFIKKVVEKEWAKVIKQKVCNHANFFIRADGMAVCQDCGHEEKFIKH